VSQSRDKVGRESLAQLAPGFRALGAFETASLCALGDLPPGARWPGRGRAAAYSTIPLRGLQAPRRGRRLGFERPHLLRSAQPAPRCVRSAGRYAHVCSEVFMEMAPIPQAAAENPRGTLTVWRCCSIIRKSEQVAPTGSRTKWPEGPGWTRVASSKPSACRLQRAESTNGDLQRG